MLSTTSHFSENNLCHSYDKVSRTPRLSSLTYLVLLWRASQLSNICNKLFTVATCNKKQKSWWRRQQWLPKRQQIKCCNLTNSYQSDYRKTSNKSPKLLSVQVALTPACKLVSETRHLTVQLQQLLLQQQLRWWGQGVKDDDEWRWQQLLLLQLYYYTALLLHYYFYCNYSTTIRWQQTTTTTLLLPHYYYITTSTTTLWQLSCNYTSITTQPLYYYTYIYSDYYDYYYSKAKHVFPWPVSETWLLSVEVTSTPVSRTRRLCGTQLQFNSKFYGSHLTDRQIALRHSELVYEVACEVLASAAAPGAAGGSS